jgi:hypothetical protein
MTSALKRGIFSLLHRFFIGVTNVTFLQWSWSSNFQNGKINFLVWLTVFLGGSRVKDTLTTSDKIRWSTVIRIIMNPNCDPNSIIRHPLVPSCPVLSRPVPSCPVLSCLVLSCPVLSCLVLSCPVLSCLVLSCPVFKLPWIPEPSVNNKLKRREGSGIQGSFKLSSLQ